MEGIELENISIPLIKGEKGDRGDTGATGATGASGVGISSAEIVDEHLILHLTSDTNIDTGLVVGAGISSIVIDEEYNLNVVLTDGTEMTVGNLEDLLDDIFTTELADYYDKDTSDGKFALITETGNKLDVSINSTTYVMTVTLKDKSNNTLSTGSVDLPLESVVVSGSYDSVNKKIVLTLQNGSTVEFSVADLVSGLQSEITNANKLSADLVDDTSTTNKFVNSTEKTKIANAVTNTDYATSSAGGTIKIGNGLAINNGIINPQAITGETAWTTSTMLNQFVSVTTARNMINYKIGDIATLLDQLNGVEV